MLKSNKNIGKARVLFPFKAQNRDELNLRVEDVVNVLQKDLPDDGWWLGEVNGVIGVFPDNFVRLLPEMQEQVKSQSQKDTNGFGNEGEDTLGLDCLKSSSNKLKHITATRVKGPQRRLPSRLSARVDNDQSSSSSIVSVVSNKRFESSDVIGDVNSGIAISHNASQNEQLDSCWGNSQDSPDSTFTSPRLISSESPSESLPPPPSESLPPPPSECLPPPPLSSVPSFINQVKHNNNIVSRTSNGSKDRNSSSINEKHKIVYARSGDYEREEVEDRMVVGGRVSGNVRQGVNIRGVGGGVMRMEEYRQLQREVETLQNDVREQAQTNERMMQTLKNFLLEEKHKVRILYTEFEHIKKTVLQDITFL